MSNIQFNLLPDIKVEYIKTQRLRRLVIAVSTIATVFSVGLFVLLFISVKFVQKVQMDNALKQVNVSSKKLEAIPDLQQALTVQNQLNTLVSLHQQKHVTSRLFTYLPQVIPSNVTLNKVDMDYSTNLMTIDGAADTHRSVNTFIDTLKFTKFKVNDADQAVNAFPSVVESSFSLTSSGVTFTLNVTFDPTLFSNNVKDANGNPKAPKLSVPPLTTTRALQDNPGTLFNGNPNLKNGSTQ